MWGEGCISKSWKVAGFRDSNTEQLSHLSGLMVKEDDCQSLCVGGVLTIGQVILHAIGMSVEIFLASSL